MYFIPTILVQVPLKMVMLCLVKTIKNKCKWPKVFLDWNSENILLVYKKNTTGFRIGKYF